MRNALLSSVAVGLIAVAASAQAGTLTMGPTTPASGLSPFTPACDGPASPGSTLYLNAEVETHIAVNPEDSDNIVAFWQQDRWSDGGARGNVAGYSYDGGLTWALSIPQFSLCAGGTALNGGNYERATDPWLSFSPDGRLHAVSLVFDNSTARNAVLAAFSDDGGANWSAPRVLRFDNPRAVGNNFNDKETLTADPLDPDLVYATWQRIVSPSERVSAKGFENAASFFSATWFARSSNGGQSWEPAREIFADRGKLTQTIGNIVDVLPNGTLINGFNLIRAVSNRHGTRGYNVALIRSTNKGLTWSREILVNRLLSDEVQDPEFPSQGVRTGDILPIWAVDRSANLASRGNIYVVWMDTRFNDPDHNDILLARSTNGGLSWDPPVVVDKTPAGVDAFTPYVDVDAEGRVAVTYYDFRNDGTGDDPLSTDLFITHSHDEGQTFLDDERVTFPSFDMRIAPDALGYFVGDYTGLAHFNDTFHAGWVGANGNLINRTDVFHRAAQ